MVRPVVPDPANDGASEVGSAKEGEHDLQRECGFVRFVCPEAVVACRVGEGPKKRPGDGEERCGGVKGHEEQGED